MELPDPRDHLRICGGRAAGTPFGLPHLAHIAVWLEKGLPGGLFLLYLAFQALQSWKKGGENIPVSGGSSRKTLLNATLVNFLNPGPYLGWSIVIGPLFLKGWNESPLYGILLVTGFYLTMFVITTMLILIFHQARERGPRLQHTLVGLSAIFLALFGLYQLYNGGMAIFDGCNLATGFTF